MAASRSLYAPRRCRDDSREDFRVLVDEHGSTLAAVCLRRSHGPADVEESAWKSLRSFLDKGVEGDYEIVLEHIAGELAYRYSVALRGGVLTDWKLAHAGWLYVVGTLSWAPPEEREITAQRTLEVLETWTWLPDPRQPDGRADS
jgi:hypothetical protein